MHGTGRALPLTPGLLTGLPLGHFRVVLADPPWNFQSNSDASPGRNARRHYHCMNLADIAALRVVDVVRDDAILFMWVPGPFMVIGAHIPIMKAWGFKPSGMGFVWIKTNADGTRLHCGNGFTTRKSAEFCLIGKRGQSVRENAGIYETFLAPRREHSRKPSKTHKRIQLYTSGPYLELFGREERAGWVVRGNEVTKFNSSKRNA